jgi:hypothetical protein
VEPAADVKPHRVAVTLYVPDAAVVAPAIDGFWSVDVKLSGPVHAYVAPATAGVERSSVDPSQIGPLFEGVGVAGGAAPVQVNASVRV